jgi:hypothetical protein
MNPPAPTWASAGTEPRAPGGARPHRQRQRPRPPGPHRVGSTVVALGKRPGPAGGPWTWAWRWGAMPRAGPPPPSAAAAKQVAAGGRKGSSARHPERSGCRGGPAGRRHLPIARPGPALPALCLGQAALSAWALVEIAVMLL